MSLVTLGNFNLQKPVFLSQVLFLQNERKKFPGKPTEILVELPWVWIIFLQKFLFKILIRRQNGETIGLYGAANAIVVSTRRPFIKDCASGVKALLF